MTRRIAALATLLTALLTPSAHAQLTWTIDPGNPQIPNYVGGGYALVPSVLYDSTAGLYRMWFTAHEPGGPWAIAYALSVDGIHWFAYAKNPVFTGGAKPFESSGAVYAGVVFDGIQYRMYYTGISDCCTTAVGLATSPDGLTWTEYPGNPVLSPSASGWDSGVIGASNGVYFDGVAFYLMYQGVGAGVGPGVASKMSLEQSLKFSTIEAGASQQIGLATSLDGVTFTKSPSNPVIGLGGSGAWDEAGVFPGGLFKIGGTLYAAYTGAPADLSKESLGLATSTNGTTWVKDAHNPLFGGGASWDWNIGSGSPLVHGNALQLWYGGNSLDGNAWSIGYATTPLDQPTAVLASLVSAAADAGGVHLEWETSADRVTLLRRSERLAWTALDTRTVTAGRVRFDDAAVQPGTRYAYSIAAGTGAGDLLLPETWIEVPARAAFELRGAQPNPSPGTITASFALPAEGRVSLELFDLAGRRMLARNLELTAGSHLLPLGPAGTAPGVYLMRVGFAGQTLESRVVVAR